MQKRREINEITKLVYSYLKKNKSKEFSINQIAREIKTRWNTTEKALDLLKFCNLVKERIEGQRKNATKFFKFLR